MAERRCTACGSPEIAAVAPGDETVCSDLLDWMGQSVDDMSREELIVALKHCAAQLDATRQQAIHINGVWRELLARSRRGASQKPQEGL